MSRQRDPGQWWTEAWSPVTGCTSAGAGCDHCWARAMVRRFPALHVPGARFRTVVFCHPDRLNKPLHWRKPRIVLVSMLGDLFHEQVPREFIADVVRVINRVECLPHRFFLLTKRPARVAEWARWMDSTLEPWHLTRIVFMASVWDQASTDSACAAFAKLPAGVHHGLHVEPMLDAIDLNAACKLPRVPQWIVCGGENGPGARPMDPRWALDLREQCRAAGVPFWFKGYGSVMKGSRFATGSGLVPLEQTREVPW